MLCPALETTAHSALGFSEELGGNEREGEAKGRRVWTEEEVKRKGEEEEE